MKTLKVALAATYVAVVGLAFTASAECTYTGSWDVAPTSAEDEIVIESGTLTWDAALPQTVASWTQNGGTVTFKTGRSDDTRTVGVEEGDERVFKVTGDVTINGGTVMHEVQPSMSASSAGWIDGKGVYRLIMDIGGDLTVAEGASISAFGKGFVGNTKGPGNFGDRGAPGHGGTGNAEANSGNTILRGCTYGCVKAPKTIGTAGSNGDNKAGGSIQLKVAGGTVLNGQLNANSSDVAWYGASGGSIYLKTKSLSGGANATISANASGSNWTAGGGRISLVLTGANQDFANFLGTVSATPKLFQNSGSSAGTIYCETAADNGKGVLLVRGLGNQSYARNFGTGLVQPGEDCDFSKIILTNGAHIAIGSNVTVRTKEILAYGGTAYHSVNLLGGKLIVPDDYVFTNITMYSYAPGSVLSPETEGSTLHLANGVTLSDDFLLTVPGDLHLLSGSAITHSGPFATDSGNRINLVCSNLTVDAGAQIHATGKGFRGLKGEGAPKDADKTARGGSHGGVAYDVGSVTTYGSITNPDTYGSGGATDAYAGGGVVRLTVRGTLTNNGTISSRSYATPWNKGGAGGSIYISTGRLVGGADAYIRADPSVMKHNYGAGGGRIAVVLTEQGATFDEFLGKITAAGEKPDANPSYEGGAGTVYLRLPGEAENEGTLIIDNGGNVKGQGRTDISTSVTGLEVGRVVVTNGAKLLVKQDVTLKVKGDFVNASIFPDHVIGELADANHAAGTVEFVDSSRTSTIVGKGIFSSFSCVTPGKSLCFPAQGETDSPENILRISANGSFTVVGAEGNCVSLASTTYNSPWQMMLGADATALVEYANVSDSDARSGGVVVADSTTVTNRCQNWKVSTSIMPGDPIEWTGVNSSAWTDPENWSPTRLPVETDVVTISADAERMPEFSLAMSFNQLIVESGASLTVLGCAFSVTNRLNVAGTLVAQGAVTATLGGDVDIAAVTGAPALVFNGSGSQVFNPRGCTFSSVTVANEGDFTIADAMTADRLSAVKSGSSMFFAAQRTVAVGELYLTSESGAADFSLRSTGTGVPWYLTVSGKATVCGVRVSDANAVGKAIHAEYPSESVADNVNWIFNETSATWLGDFGSDWFDARNWSGDTLPGVSSRVILGEGAQVSVTNDVRVRMVEVTGNVMLKGTGTVSVVDAIDVGDGGTLSAGTPLRSEGDCYVRTNGVLTHPDNGTGSEDTGVGLSLSVAGDMIVEASGRVTAEGKGFAVAKGPGGKFSGNYGGMHAGRVRNASQSVTYGSILHPATLGSGGSGADSRNGGGRIRLSVDGTLRVEGSIDADGQTSGVKYYLGAGGSIWITCGTLAGTVAGSISANGGRGTDGSSGQSGGGRIAIYQTVATDFTGFAGTVRATAGWSTQVGNAPIQNAAGTIYLQSAGQPFGGGKVTISQFGGDSLYDLYDNAAVEVPVAVERGGDGDRAYRSTAFEVISGGSLSLLSDLVIAELEISGDKSRIYLNGHALTILSRAHKNGKGWPSNWQSLVSKGADAAGNPGQIVWAPRPLCLILR